MTVDDLLALCDVTPLLNLEELQGDSGDATSDGCVSLHERGIPTAFRLRRILVEKTPNFTPAVALFTGSLTHRHAEANRGLS